MTSYMHVLLIAVGMFAVLSLPVTVAVPTTSSWTCTPTQTAAGTCDAHCTSTCAMGAGSCDRTCCRCYGFSAYKCYGCSKFCNSTCNSHPTLCDGPCAVGYVFNTATYACDQCDIHCTADPDIVGAGCATNKKGKCDSKCIGGWTMSTAAAGTTAWATCVQCDVNCIGTCNNYKAGTCDVGSCKAGYGVNPTTHVCGACAANCQSVIRSCDTKGPGKCDYGKCIAGYTNSSTYTCVACDANCKVAIGACNIKGPNKCDATCKPGYTLVTTPTTNYTCIDIDECLPTSPCQTNAYCTNTPGSYTCTCNPGFVGNGTVCIATTTTVCDPHCVANGCTSTGSGHCDSACVTGFGINKANNTCGGCDPLCNSTCNAAGPGTCDGPCLSGNGLTAANFCRACDPNCAVSICNTYGAGACDGACANTPLPGYGINKATHSCGACDAHCTSGCAHFGGGQCDKTCENGYAISNATGAPICVACQDLCLGTCTQPGTCDGPCAPGYVVVLDSTVSPPYNVCLPCDPHCQNVTGACDKQGQKKCDTTCVAGYGLTTDYYCQPCDQNCLAGCVITGVEHCDNTTSPACKPGYGIKLDTFNPPKTLCSPCAAGCSTCASQGAGCCDDAASCTSGTTYKYDSTMGCNYCG